MVGESVLTGFNVLPTGLALLQRVGPPYTPGLLEKSAEPSPLDATLAFQQGLGRGRWTMSPEVRKCHGLEVSHRSGASGFGQVNTGIVEGDTRGMCLQNFLYGFNHFSGASETGEGGTGPRAGNPIDAPSILWEESLKVKVQHIIPGRLQAKATGLCLLVRARSRSRLGGPGHRGPHSLHRTQQGSLHRVFSVGAPGTLVLIQAVLLWGGVGRNVLAMGTLSVFSLQATSRLGLQFLRVESRKDYMSVFPFRWRIEVGPWAQSLGTELSKTPVNWGAPPKAKASSLQRRAEPRNSPCVQC